MLSSKIVAVVGSKAATPLFISARGVSKLTFTKLERAKHRHINQFPPILVPEVTAEKTDILGDIETKSTRFDHPMPEYFNPRNPEQKLNPTDMFAIVNVNGKQYKVTNDDLIMVNKLKDVEVGEKLAFDQVLLLGARNFTVVGQPFVKGAVVVATCEQQTQTQQLNIYKAKQRTGYRNLMRYRDQVTILRINTVMAAPEALLSSEQSKTAEASM